MQLITISDVEYLAFQLAKEILAFNEPIPDFSSRFPNILESCVLTPFQKFDSKSLYPSLINKAGILFYLMIKNHPFENGNKRIAITTLLMFLHRNSKWLKVDIQELYQFTIWVAGSSPKVKNEVDAAIQKFIKTYLIDL